MNKSFVTKQIAKEIELIRYLPEHQVYELLVQWEHKADSTVTYLPEMFLYPYAIKHQASNIQETKVSDLSSSIEVEVDIPLNMASLGICDKSIGLAVSRID